VVLWQEKDETQRALDAEAAARGAEAAQRGRAEGNLVLAFEAVDELYLKAEEHRFPRAAELTEEDCTFLRTTLHFYKEFARRNAEAGTDASPGRPGLSPRGGHLSAVGRLPLIPGGL
jgi:hypothetical protein